MNFINELNFVKNIKVINNSPFFFARYCGNYDLNRFINMSKESSDSIVSFFNNLFEKNNLKKGHLNKNRVIKDPGCSAFF